MLDLKKDKSTECLFVWKSNRLLRFRIYPLLNAFLPIMERFEYKIGIQFNNNALVIAKKSIIKPKLILPTLSKFYIICQEIHLTIL